MRDVSTTFVTLMPKICAAIGGRLVPPRCKGESKIVCSPSRLHKMHMIPCPMNLSLDLVYRKSLTGLSLACNGCTQDSALLTAPAYSHTRVCIPRCRICSFALRLSYCGLPQESKLKDCLRDEASLHSLSHFCVCMRHSSWLRSSSRRSTWRTKIFLV